MNRPDRCPFGHDLGPGKLSLSWAMEEGEHRLYCVSCNLKTRILLVEGARWQTVVAGRGWVDV